MGSIGVQILITGVTTATIELGAQGRDASDQNIDLSPLRDPNSILQPDAITEVRIEIFPRSVWSN